MRMLWLRSSRILISFFAQEGLLCSASLFTISTVMSGSASLSCSAQLICSLELLRADCAAVRSFVNGDSR